MQVCESDSEAAAALSAWAAYSGDTAAVTARFASHKRRSTLATALGAQSTPAAAPASAPPPPPESAAGPAPHVPGSKGSSFAESVPAGPGAPQEAAAAALARSKASSMTPPAAISGEATPDAAVSTACGDAGAVTAANPADASSLLHAGSRRSAAGVKSPTITRPASTEGFVAFARLRSCFTYCFSRTT